MIPQTFVDIDYLLNYIGLNETTSTTSRLGAFSPIFVLSISFFVPPHNFVVSGAFNSSLHPFFILNTNHLLILLM